MASRTWFAICTAVFLSAAAFADDDENQLAGDKPVAMESDESGATAGVSERATTDADKPVRRSKTVARTPAAAKSEAESGSWLRTIGSLAGVLALIVFLAWGYRAVTTGGVAKLRRGRRPGLVEILSRTSLSPKQSICLVRIGPRAVLVGVSGDSLRTLDVIEDAGLVAQLAGEANRKADPAASEFQNALRGEEREFARADAEQTDDPAEAAIRALTLKQKLLSASQRVRAAR